MKKNEDHESFAQLIIKTAIHSATFKFSATQYRAQTDAVRIKCL